MDLRYSHIAFIRSLDKGLFPHHEENVSIETISLSDFNLSVNVLYVDTYTIFTLNIGTSLLLTVLGLQLKQNIPR